MKSRRIFHKSVSDAGARGQLEGKSDKGFIRDKKGTVLLVLVVVVVAAALVWLYLEWSGFWSGGTASLTREPPINFASRYLEAKYPDKTFIFSAREGYRTQNGWLFRFADEAERTAYEGVGQDGKFPYIILVSDGNGAGYKAGDDYYITYISDDAESYIRDLLQENGFDCKGVMVESASIGGLDYNSTMSFSEFIDGELGTPLKFTVYIESTDTAPDDMTAENAAGILKAGAVAGRYRVCVERDGKTSADVSFDL